MLTRYAIALFVFSIVNILFAAEADIEWNFGKSPADFAINGKILGTAVIDNGLKICPTKREGFSIPACSELSPQTAFRISADFTMGPPTFKEDLFILWDNKGNPNKKTERNQGFMLGLRRLPNDEYIPVAGLGFGRSESVVYGKPVTLTPGQHCLLEFDYDGANEGCFYIDGVINNRIPIYPGGSIAVSNLPALIGGCCDVSGMSFNGIIHAIRIGTHASRELGLTICGRRVFRRGEENAAVTVQVGNYTKYTFRNLVLKGSVYNVETPSAKLAELAPGKTVYLTLPVETRLHDGTYSIKLEASGESAKGKTLFGAINEISIAPAQKDVFPVVMWGYVGPHKDLQSFGFTHATTQGFRNIFPNDLRSDGDAPASRQMKIDYLDDILKDGFAAIDTVEAHFLQNNYPRCDRAGKPYRKKNLEASNPEVMRKMAKVASETGNIYGNHPALAGLLINSELRDKTMPSFGGCEPEAFRKATGLDIPPQVTDKLAPHYTSIPDFPLSRIIPDNDILLIYYKWFWRSGDGWNLLNSVIHNSYKQNIKKPFWTFHDPAVRVPPLWGSGGEVDRVSQWTYAYPDPFRVVAATDETFAMADGRSGQGVMAMTQLIAKTYEVTPSSVKAVPRPEWCAENKDAKYVSAAPDEIQEATWGMISRPVSAVMYYGQGSGVCTVSRGRVMESKMTNFETPEALKQIIKEVVLPLGPVLGHLERRPSQVAIFQSFASSIFAHRGTYGWKTWAFDAALIMHWARLNPCVVYEEKIQRDGLSGIKVLLMAHCDVLSESTYKAIREFQEKGGIIIADEFLTPALTPNININSIPRTQTLSAAETKDAMQKCSGLIRRQLTNYYQPYADSNQPDILTYPSFYGKADYLFVINDKRTYGDYFGPWKQAQEKGVPNSGTVTVRRSSGAVYELSRGGQVPFVSKDGSTAVDLRFATNDGRLLLFLDKPISGIILSVPRMIVVGDKLTFSVEVMDSDGKLVPAALPVDIAVIAPDGKKSSDSGYAAVLDGVYKHEIQTALNDLPGIWHLKVTDRASGLFAEKSFEMIQPEGRTK